MSDSLTLTTFIPAKPEQVYDAWLNSEQHSAMTGAEARLEPKEGAQFVAWDGYIHGANVALEPPRVIRQSWRATDFPDDARDSQLMIQLEPEGEGTRMTLKHTGIPSGRAYLYEQGWKDYYLEPMREYFVQRALAILERRGDAPTAKQAAEAGQAWTDPLPEPPMLDTPEPEPQKKAQKKAPQKSAKKVEKKAAKKTPKKTPAAKPKAPAKGKTSKAAAKKVAPKKSAAKKPAAKSNAKKKPAAGTKARASRKGTTRRK
jgi:uncharacterized protein YndB with AHSA1/START domain